MPLDLQCRAAVRPATLNREARTVEVILSTGADVPRGHYVERLQVTRSAINLDRLPVPVLDGHRRDGIDAILGNLTEVRIEAGKLVGTITISKRHAALLDDIEEGSLRSISVGYTVDSFRDEADRATGQLVRIITGWTLAEASFVPIPADAGATVRSNPMPDPNPTANAPAVTTSAPAPAVQTRAQVNTEIRALRTTFGLPETFADDLIDREASIDQARAAAVEAVRARGGLGNPTPIVPATVTTMTSADAFVRAAGEALYCRSNPSQKPSDAAREFMGLSIPDLGRLIVSRSGVLTTALSTSAVIERALTTSDFPTILGDTLNRSMLADYKAAPSAVKRVARQSTARDFRRKISVQLGEAPTLKKVTEGGEFEYGSMDEAKESYKIETFGKIIGVTRKLLVNDDLGAFTDMAGKFGQAAADFEAQQLVDLLEANAGAGPVMDDGETVFHTTHGNLAASGTALSVDALGAARLSMRKQKGLAGRPIAVSPRFLIVPPELETEAEKLIASITPANSGDVNPFGGKLEALVEPRLSSATRWYVVSDPATTEGLEYSYLQGEEGPQFDTRVGFEVDGMEFKVRLDFGAAFLEHRGWFMNPGA